MRIFIETSRVRVVSFRVRSTPRRPQQGDRLRRGRAAPERLARPKAEQVFDMIVRDPPFLVFGQHSSEAADF